MEGIMTRFIVFVGVLLVSILSVNATDVSFFGPNQYGLNGIQTLRFSGVKSGPRSQHFEVQKNTNPDIPLKCLKFDDCTQYVEIFSDGSGIPYSEKTQKQIKEEISAFATTQLTYSFTWSQVSVLDSYGLMSKESVSRFHNLHLMISPHDRACLEKNAFYRRTGYEGGQGHLNFCSGGNPKTVRLFDVVSHETGHAILDALNPVYYSTNHAFSSVHESFGDLTSLFTSLSLANLKGKTEQVGFFLHGSGLCIARGWDGINTCLRKPYSIPSLQLSCEAHDNSMLLTRFICDAMRQTHQTLCPSKSFLNYPMTTVQYFQQLLLSTVTRTPKFKTLGGFIDMLQDTNDSFRDADLINPYTFLQKCYFVLSGTEQEDFYGIVQESLERKLNDSLDRC